MNVEGCRQCQDTGFEQVGKPSTNTVVPCSRCRPTQRSKWANGGYEPGFRRREGPRPGDKNMTREEVASAIASLHGELARLAAS